MALDIIFMSYDEVCADEHWGILSSMYPYAKRVHGVKGIREAHIEAANTAMTSSFFVVDGDTEVLPESEAVFNYKPESWDKKYVHIWNSLNPANQLVYGYGGIKLFHKSMFVDLPEGSYTDFTTSIGEGIKVMEGIPSVTHFDSSPYLAFRGALRETAKLANITRRKNTNLNDPVVAEAFKRLSTWIVPGQWLSSVYANQIEAGARIGYQFGGCYDDISFINDHEWLYHKYKEEYAIPD